MEHLSDELFKKSKVYVPGGVHSPVRSFKGLFRDPIFVKSAQGAKFISEDGNEYIDFCMSFGPLILGHQNEAVKQELSTALSRGWSYGACERYSLELAEYLVSKITFIDQIRFVNSGTEAVMTAIRLARGYTGKNKIVKFDGCYHGHVDSMLIKAGSGLAGTPEASSKGIPPGVAQDTIVLDLNNLSQVEKVFEDYKDQIAAVIIEPLPANNGLLKQSQEYLTALRQITEKHHALLIFDEVISGFRVSFGGMAEKFNIIPDLLTYGKIIGGGLPVGAVAGRKEIMNELAPLGPIYQAGTLSANPLAMVGGLATLKQLTPHFYEKLNHNTQVILGHFSEYFSQQEQFKDISIISEQSLFWFVPGTPPQRAADIPASLNVRFNILFEQFLKKGIYLAPNGYEVGFVSLAHDEKVAEEIKNSLWP